jgi:CO/xanthine dehydrogenase FAD-binding subunit
VKPAPFDYYQPETVADALALLDQFDETAKPLAGGQSLVPMMNMRLARPAQLIALNGLPELSYLKIENGELCIGAMTRQRVLERSAMVAEGWPLLPEAARHIGHVQIRNRGTVGGSLVHAYPSAELPVIMTALDAWIELRSPQEARTLSAREFFVDVMTTALKPGELLVEVRVPQLAPRTGWAFQEVSRRHGDFALMGVAALLTIGGSGNVDQARLVFAGAKPHLSKMAEAQLVGRRSDAAAFRDVAKLAAAELEPQSDIHAGADYRRQVAEVLARRVLEQAAARASTRQ